MRAGIGSHIFAICLLGLYWTICKGQSDAARPAVEQAAQAGGYHDVVTAARGWPIHCGKHASQVDVTATDAGGAQVTGYACIRTAGPELHLRQVTS